MIFSLSRSIKYSYFFHSDLRRCNIIDQHLETLAQKHFDTKAIRVNVEKDFLGGETERQSAPLPHLVH